MMPDIAVSKIMRIGLILGVVVMTLGEIFILSGAGALGEKLIYAGILTIIATPAVVLAYLAVYFIIVKKFKYTLYCIMIITFLCVAVSVRI
jgi:hypothetical protein